MVVTRQFEKRQQTWLGSDGGEHALAVAEKRRKFEEKQKNIEDTKREVDQAAFEASLKRDESAMKEKRSRKCVEVNKQLVEEAIASNTAALVKNVQLPRYNVEPQRQVKSQRNLQPHRDVEPERNVQAAAVQHAHPQKSARNKR